MEFEKHPFFDQVGAEDTSGLAEIANREEYPSDTIIFEEGSSSEALYLVLEGEVAFCKRAEEGKYRGCRILFSGGPFFGEIGLFTDEPRALRAESRGRDRPSQHTQGRSDRVHKESSRSRSRSFLRISSSTSTRLHGTTWMDMLQTGEDGSRRQYGETP